MLDSLAPPAIAAFRLELTEALDQYAPDAVTLIQDSGAVDGARKQSLEAALRQLVASVAEAAPPPADPGSLQP